jgi:hypothetical protein
VTDENIKEGLAVIANPEAGELFALERDERRRIVQICVEVAAGRCPIVAGVVHVSTKGYVECAQDAQEEYVAISHPTDLRLRELYSGAQGLFLFPPIGAGDIVAMWDSDKCVRWLELCWLALTAHRYPEVFVNVLQWY